MNRGETTGRTRAVATVERVLPWRRQLAQASVFENVRRSGSTVSTSASS